MENQKNNHHFVPQFYLKKFSNNRKSVGAYLLNNHKYVEHASIKEIAYRKHLYGKDDDIENALAHDEGLWNKIIEEIIRTKHINLSDEDYLNLLMFITVTEARTSFTADYNNKEINVLYDLIYKLETGKNKTLDVEFKIPNLIPLKSALEIYPILFDLDIILVVNNSNRGFITSDNPVVRYNQFFVYRHYYRNYGLGHMGIQIFFPLSPEVCICVYDRTMYKPKTDGIITVKSGSQINELNKLFLLNAYQTIFFNNQQKESYIRSLIKYRNSKNSFDIPVFGAGNHYLIQTSHPSVHDRIKLSFFSINPDLLDVSLPAHAAGPIRPYAEEFDKNKKRKRQLEETKESPNG